VAATSRAKFCAAITLQIEGLASVGSHLTDMGRVGCNDLADAGRGGYNDVTDAGQGGYQENSNDEEKTAGGIIDFLVAFGQSRNSQSSRPMQQFLDVAGPWSALEMRGD
jgi:hypothetical protein